MATWLPISYRGYWDVPRIILVQSCNRVLLFDCQFNDEVDDYPDEYTVFEMPPGTNEDNSPHDWRTLRDLAIRQIGVIPVKQVMFDERDGARHIDSAVLARLFSANGTAPHGQAAAHVT